MSDEQEPRYAAVLKRFRETRNRLEHGHKRARSSQEKEDIKGEPPHKTTKADSVEKPDDPEAEPLEEVSNAPREDAVTADGLEPLPQPAPVREKRGLTQLQWLVQPERIEPVTRAPFESLGLSPDTVKRLHEEGFEQAFAVQCAVIPAVLKDQRKLSPDPLPNILVNSFTGSGKTLAYCAPIVDTLKTQGLLGTFRALIIVPTAALLGQVISALELLLKGTLLHCMSFKSDRALGRERQILESKTPDIVVTTPGRLIDHLKEMPELLASLKFLVIDEADRLLGQSFHEWTDKLAEASPLPLRPLGLAPWSRPPQRLIFSATLTRDPGKLAALQVTSTPTPARVFVVGDGNEQLEFTLPVGLYEKLLRVNSSTEKPLALVSRLIEHGHTSRTIVFVRSNEAAARLAHLIPLVGKFVYGIELRSSRCSGELPVAERKRTLRLFAEGKIGILVCTDMIARGIDVEGVDCVVNYDLPLGTREYVHRVGRTARAGGTGSAWTLTVSSAERKHFWQMQSDVSRQNKIGVEHVETKAEEAYQEALRALESDVMGHDQAQSANTA